MRHGADVASNLPKIDTRTAPTSHPYSGEAQFA